MGFVTMFFVKRARIARILTISFLFISFFGMISCSGKYSDVRSLLRDAIKAMDSFSKEMASAESGHQAAQAIDRFVLFLEKNGKRMAEIDSRYPELAEAFQNQPGDLPADLLELNRTFREVSKKAMGRELAAKFAQFGMDQEVVAARGRLQNVLILLQQKQTEGMAPDPSPSNVDEQGNTQESAPVEKSRLRPYKAKPE